MNSQVVVLYDYKLHIAFLGLTCKPCFIKTMLEDNIPGVYVTSLMIGNNVLADTENGFFKE